MSYRASADGACTICGERSFPAWPGWECRRTLRTRSSIIKQARFLELQPSISGMILLERKEALDRWGAHVGEIVQASSSS